MEPKDYVLQIKVRNGPLLRAMRDAGFETAADLSRAAGVGSTEIGEYLALKRAPLRRNGAWRLSIERIARTLRVIPELLFPEQHLDKALTKSEAEVEMSIDEIEGLTSRGSLAIDWSPQEDRIAEREQRDAVHSLLLQLTAREQRVIRLRFGLDGLPPTSYAEIAPQMGVGAERIRQIEAKALRKLRRPRCHQKVIDAGWEPSIDGATAERQIAAHRARLRPRATKARQIVDEMRRAVAGSARA